MKTTRVQDAGSSVAITQACDGDIERTGMTLMEVLMSCAIMTIGVVMVATVFPLSTLRVLEASKQTNSTITRFSAEALIDVDPFFVNNPDGVGGAAGVNNPGYRVPVYFVDPYGYQTFHADAAFAAPIGAGPIQTNVTSLLRDTWGWLPPGNATLPLGTRVNVPLPRRYVGASMFPVNPGTTPGVSIRPYPSNAQESESAIARAVQLVGQPDNWKTVAEGLMDPISSTTNITSLTLENDVDLSSVPPTILSPYAPVAYRAVIFDRLGDQGGHHSEIRYLTASSSSPPTVTWATPLSTRFENGNIGKVRIEQLDEVYTWALTVRRLPTGDSNIDVVVFFKRSFNPEHEYVYPAAFRQFSLEEGTSLGGTTGQPGADGYDDNENGQTDEAAEIGFPKRLQSVSGVALTVAQQSDDEPTPIVRVDFQSLPAGTDRPVFRKGGFVCDTKNGLWYRIQGTQNETDTTIELVLDKFIQQDGTEDRIQPVPLPYPYSPTFDAGEDTNGNGVFESGGIYWNPTVVNVFSVR